MLTVSLAGLREIHPEMETMPITLNMMTATAHIHISGYSSPSVLMGSERLACMISSFAGLRHNRLSVA